MFHKVGDQLILTKTPAPALIDLNGLPCTILRMQTWDEEMPYLVEVKYHGIPLLQWVSGDMLAPIDSNNKQEGNINQ